MNIKKMYEERKSLIADMTDISTQAKEKNEGGLMTPEQEDRWNKLEAEESKLSEEIRKAETAPVRNRSVSLLMCLKNAAGPCDHRFQHL